VASIGIGGHDRFAAVTDEDAWIRGADEVEFLVPTEAGFRRVGAST